MNIDILEATDVAACWGSAIRRSQTQGVAVGWVVDAPLVLKIGALV